MFIHSWKAQILIPSCCEPTLDKLQPNLIQVKVGGAGVSGQPMKEEVIGGSPVEAGVTLWSGITKAPIQRGEHQVINPH